MGISICSLALGLIHSRGKTNSENHSPSARRYARAIAYMNPNDVL